MRRDLPPYNVRLVIEYDGAAFHGYQFQPGTKTVQGELQRALDVVLRERAVLLTAAGRTDAGVHARGQVVNFFVSRSPDLIRLRYAVSSMLRNELSVVSADLVPSHFDARRSAVLKQYTYRILNRPVPPTLDQGRAWHVASPLDIGAMSAAALELIGTHDFTSLRAANCGARSPLRTIVRSEIVQEAPFICYVVQSRSFLKHMVRNIVGTLVTVGRNPAQALPISEVLSRRDRRIAAATAPAHGLYLDWVRYEDAVTHNS